MTNKRVIPMLVLVLTMAYIGIAGTTNLAYADSIHCSPDETSVKAPPVVTSIIPTSDGALIEWTQQELDADIVFFFTIHLDCAFPNTFEIEVFDEFTDYEDGGDSGEYTIEGLECGTEYDFDVDGLWITPFFGGFHIDGDDESFTTLPCETPKSSGHSCTNCQQPSIGRLENGDVVVYNGLTVNGETVNATFYHTDFPLIQSEIGQPIDFIFKVWDDRIDNIKHLQIQLGKSKVGESFTLDSSTTWDRNVMTGEVTITSDPLFTNVVIERLEDQPCKNDETVLCSVFHANLTPTQAIVGDVVFGVNIWDDNRNAVTTFFNHGIQVGTEGDIVSVDNSTPIVVKNQLRTDDGLGDINKRYSEAFHQKYDWHTENMQKLAASLGY